MGDRPMKIESSLLEVCNARLRPKTPLTVETDLLEQGLLDSLLVMDLVNVVEAKFGIALDNADISPQNFRSIRDLARLITSH
jgi:acyl carrier protein